MRMRSPRSAASRWPHCRPCPPVLRGGRISRVPHLRRPFRGLRRFPVRRLRAKPPAAPLLQGAQLLPELWRARGPEWPRGRPQPRAVCPSPLVCPARSGAVAPAQDAPTQGGRLAIAGVDPVSGRTGICARDSCCLGGGRWPVGSSPCDATTQAVVLRSARRSVSGASATTRRFAMLDQSVPDLSTVSFQSSSIDSRPEQPSAKSTLYLQRFSTKTGG